MNKAICVFAAIYLISVFAQQQVCKVSKSYFVRSGPSGSLRSVRKAPIGETVTVFEQFGNWLKIANNEFILKSGVSSCKNITTPPKELEPANATITQTTETQNNNTIDTTDLDLVFNYPKPDVSKAQKLTLWATNYNSPLYMNGSEQSGYSAIRDVNSKPLAWIKTSEWCHLNIQGSGRVKFKDGTKKTFSIDKQVSKFPVTCSGKTKKSTFYANKSPYGNGAYLPVIPYRALAVDKTTIPYGSVVYIPSAVGNLVEVKGQKVKHDGYFIASDCGSAIKGNHIDVFSGGYKYVPFFPWIQAKSSKTFTAYIVNDEKIKKEMKSFANSFK